MPAVLKPLLALAVAVVVSAQAATYDFLLVTTNSTSGIFTSTNGNGFITAVATGGPFLPGHHNTYTSYFPNLFPASGNVPGYITRADNLADYTVTFYLTNYALSSNTVFGMWNITEETHTYSLQLFAGNTLIAPPFNWNFIGYDDDALSGNVAWHHMNLDFATGIFNPTNYTTFGPKIDCDGAFWDNIPTNTTRIVLRGQLNATNHDGVVYYFAEPKRCKVVCPQDIVVRVCGLGTNVFYPQPTLTGECSTNVTVECDPPSGSFFSLGTHGVVCAISGQTNPCTFTVTVINSDTNPPVITCPSNIVLYTCGTNAVATYTVTATDDQSTPAVTCNPPSGSTFPLGTNAVGCVAVDACSNAVTCAFYVIVKQIPPDWTLICTNAPAFINVTGCPPVMPNLTSLVTISNQCPIPGGLSLTQSPPAGAVLTPGSHLATVTVCDTNGACDLCEFTVNATLSAGCCTTQTFLTLFSGATNGTLLAGGALDPQFTASGALFTTPHPYVPASIHPAWLPNGPNSQWVGPVTNVANLPAGLLVFSNRFFLDCTNEAVLAGQWALDDAGAIWLNGAPTGVEVTTAGAHASWHPVTISSGFVPGWNTLVFYVTNVVFSVTGLRTELTGTVCCTPGCVSITCPTNRIVGTCSNSTKVDYAAPSASSACGTIASVSCTPPSGSFFPLGTTVVQCTAIDSLGNAATCSFTVTVVRSAPLLCSRLLWISLQANSLRISWPADDPGAELQDTTSLAPPIHWEPVNEPIQTIDGTNHVTLPLSGTTRFFRLGPANPDPGS